MLTIMIFPSPFCGGREKNYVQELIKDQVANMYLWPKTLEVQVLDSAMYASLI